MNLQCGAYFAPACDCMFLATDLSVMHLSPRRGVKSVPKVRASRVVLDSRRDPFGRYQKPAFHEP